MNKGIKRVKTEKDYIKLLKEAASAYYNDDAIMSDEEFDKLRDEFEKLYPNHLFLKEVGARVQSTFKVVKHQIPMGSLLKVNTEDEVKFWFEKYAEKKTVLWSEKIDGLSISLYYNKGKFTQAVTRGDGSEGEDVTENVRLMQFEKNLKSAYTGFIRGEIVLEKKDYLENFQDKANPRNAASGSVRRLDGERCEYLKIFCYWIDADVKTEADRFSKIKELGLKTPAYGICKDIPAIQKLWTEYEVGSREKATYEIDGLCLFVNSIEEQDELGIIDNRPRYARAYKFSPQSSVSKIEDVIWSVGRTGAVTPVAKITPVTVSGALITNVSLHNIGQVEKLGIQMGQVVHVERKGDVIPQITKTVGTGTKLNVPKKCPSCDSKLERIEN